MLFSIFVFFIIIVLLVLSHEFGHFFASRKSGVKVEEFGFGLPPRILSYQGKETLYSLNLLPLGGFVKIKGEEEENFEKDSFLSKSIGVKTIIVAAGAIFNIILGYILFTFLATYGIPMAIEEISADSRKITKTDIAIINVLKDSIAEKAGLKQGNVILFGLDETGNKKEFKTISDVQNFVASSKGKEIRIIAAKNKKEREIKILVPDIEKPLIGIAMQEIATVKSPLWRAPYDGFILTAKTTKQAVFGVYAFLKNLIVREEPALEMVAGPVGLVAIVNAASGFGFIFLLHLTALLSISIAIINLFPFPALDGGRLLFLFAEIIFKKPISHKTAGLIHAIGFAILLTFMLVVTYFDIRRFF